MDEESYVIRIYRKTRLPEPMRRVDGGRRRHDRCAVAGVVEIVERGERRTFHDVEELWAILAGAAAAEPGD